MIVFAALVVLIVAFCGCIKFIAEFDGKKPNADRAFLRDTTPDHYQGRAGDFDEHGRPW